MSLAEYIDLFRVQTGKPELVQAQIKALSTRIPLLFFITVINTLTVAYSHLGVAPVGLTIGFPVLATIGYVWRGLDWIKLGYRPISDTDAERLLKLTTILGPACSAIVLAWALCLYPYGDAYAQGEILFYFGVTLVSCAFCMMHLRPAALLMTGVTVIPFDIFFLTTGRPIFIAVVLTMSLVAAAMIYIVLVFWNDFARMIEYQKELIESEKVNARLANTDSLTELPNRRQFLSTLEAFMSRAGREPKPFVVGLVDLDRFKSVNDLYGHVVGDRVLVEAARRMFEICDDEISLARLGGDEFGVIIDNDVSDAEIEAFGLRVCEVLAAPFVMPGIVVEMSASVGFAAFPKAGLSATLIFERADYALYYAKQNRRGRPMLFSIEHETEIRQLAKLEQCLRHADLASEMSLHYQPIVNFESGRTIGFEALARWVSPTLGRVTPDVFIRAAERSDLINELTRTLLRRALSEARCWPEHIRISFNLSVRDLGSDEAISNIVSIIEDSGVAPRRIDLEVTETALIQDFDQAKVSLQTLKSLGVGVSLDDFGAGYSSLSYLQQFPIDKIKIDRGLIKEVETKTSCRAIVKSVIDLCRNLNLACVVEGMESANQARILHELGCTTMQGYFFGKPMPAHDVCDFLKGARSERQSNGWEVKEVA